MSASFLALFLNIIIYLPCIISHILIKMSLAIQIAFFFSFYGSKSVGFMDIDKKFSVHYQLRHALFITYFIFFILK